MCSSAAGGRTARVTGDHKASYSDPLAVQVGERVQVSRRDDTWPAFVWCMNAAGKGGWVPETVLRRDGADGTALRGYDTRELSVSAGETVSAGERLAGWVWVTNTTGDSGWVPEASLDIT